MTARQRLASERTLERLFFSPLPLLTIALFGLNNAWLKFAFPGFITGKLSDLTACFFLPLFVGWFAERLLRLSYARSLALGALLTVFVFTGMKTSLAFSDFASALISRAGALLAMGPSRNIVDPSDLLALPFVAISLIWAHLLSRRP
jgi:hypothetical protein